MGGVNERVLQVIAARACTVDGALRDAGFSVTIRRALRKELGAVCLGAERPVRLCDPVAAGQSLYVRLRDVPTRPIPPYSLPLEIVYEDDDLAVVDKPRGLAVISTHGHYGKSLENALAARWGAYVYRPVGRLDRDTTGLMIVAKNAFAHSRLTRRYGKAYLALCGGDWHGSGVIDAPLRPSGKGWAQETAPDGKPARSRYCALESFGGNTLCALVPETGRTHQLRAHCAAAGHPIAGDGVYGGDCTAAGSQLLHCAALDIVQPVSGERLTLFSRPDFIAYDELWARAQGVLARICTAPTD